MIKTGYLMSASQKLERGTLNMWTPDKKYTECTLENSALELGISIWILDYVFKSKLNLLLQGIIRENITTQGKYNYFICLSNFRMLEL